MNIRTTKKTRDNNREYDDGVRKCNSGAVTGGSEKGKTGFL